MSPTISFSADAAHQLIRERRSIRQYQDRPVSRTVLRRLLETAMWAPSAHNRQPWRFVVLTQQADQQQLADVMAERLTADLRADGVSEDIIEKDTSRSRHRLTGAAALILVNMTMVDMDQYPDEQRQANERIMATQSVAMAAQNLLLAAHAEGLGAVWMCAPLFCPGTVRRALKLPEDFEPQGVVALGYPAEERQKTREPLGTRVIFR